MIYLLVLLSCAVMVRMTRYLREPNLAIFLLACGLATFAALRAPDVANDFVVYQEWYQLGYDAEGLVDRPAYLEGLFFGGMALSNWAGLPFRLFIWVVATTAIGLNFYSIYQYALSRRALFAGASCYLFSGFLLHEFTQLRAGLAIACFLLSLVLLGQGRKRAYLIAIGIGSFIHLSVLLGLLALPFSVFRRGRLDVLLVGTLAVAMAARLGGLLSLERIGEALSVLDPRIDLYVQFANSGITEAINPLSIRTGLVLLIILSSYVGLHRLSRRVPTHPQEARVMTNRSAAFLMMLRLVVVAQTALVVFADVREVGLRMEEFYMACLPLFAAQLAQTKGMKVPSALVWLWLAATFVNYVFRAPVLVEAYSFGF
jgi:hypothetical protein